uniref:Uncharacterized protein n=1 Tax=Panagrolaimus sp. ES5 TaxID=591445 RepID=A0AC34G047_9BILA
MERDPDGMGPADIHLKFQNSEAKNAYINTVNKSLGGTYTASTVKVKDGKGFSDKVVLTKGDGSKATAEQKAFSELYSGAVNSKTVVRQEVVSNSKDVEVGNFDTNQFDISDVQQFDKAGKGGSTTAGALIHETIEQLDKANQGMGPGESLTSAEFDQAHQKASKAEDKVNRNTRVEGNDSDVFKERNGTRTRQTVSSTSAGDGMAPTDDYKLLRNGDIQLIAKTTGKIYATNDDGQVDKSKKMEVSEDFMKSHKTVKNEDGSVGDVYNVSNNQEGGKQAFEFLANNTDVEFNAEHLQRLGNKSVTVIQTDHDHDHVFMTGVSKQLKEGDN